MVKKPKKKREKLAFWKKLGPEGKRIADHTGKIIDNSRISDVSNAILDVALAYYGVKAFGHIGGAIIGPISMRLATSMNAVAGAAGVAGLAALGLASTGRIQDIVDALVDPALVLVDGERFDRDQVIAPSVSPDFPWDFVCPEGYKLVRGPSAAFCVPTQG